MSDDEHFAKGGLIPGQAFLTVVDHPKGFCTDWTHLHSDECIIGREGKCKRTDDIHRAAPWTPGESRWWSCPIREAK